MNHLPPFQGCTKRLMMFISFYKTPKSASEPAHNWPVNQYLYDRQGKADGGMISVQHVLVCLCESVCVYLNLGLKLKHLLPSTPIPSVEMAFKQTNKSAENDLYQLQSRSK